MPPEVWLHIGTPKSGTSSLQKYLVAHRDALRAGGLEYLTPPGKSSANNLVIAANKRRETLSTLAGGMDRALRTCDARVALISSEMLYGFAPERLVSLLPSLGQCRLTVLVYLRRQDRYIEAMYLQKSKNGRFTGSIAEYIARFEGSGADYAAMLAPWEGMHGVRLVPRILERDHLMGGDVVTDALSEIGVAPPVKPAIEENASPALARVQLLQRAAAAGLANPRRLQRLLSADHPQRPEDRTPILSTDERQAFLARFAAGNDQLRERYFPQLTALFPMDDLSDARPSNGVPPFTAAQLAEIDRLLQTLKKLGSA